MIVVCILAAGASSRMRGRDKLLEPVAGVPILRHLAAEALRASIGPVAAFLRVEDDARREALSGLDLAILKVPTAHLGMSETLKACAKHSQKLIPPGAGAAAPCGLLVLLPDMPGLLASDLQQLAQVFLRSGGLVTRASTEDGLPGHPVIIPSSILPSFAQLSGDQGAAALLAGQPCTLVALKGNKARLDLDTPEDWEAWRNAPS